MPKTDKERRMSQNPAPVEAASGAGAKINTAAPSGPQTPATPAVKTDKTRLAALRAKKRKTD